MPRQSVGTSVQLVSISSNPHPAVSAVSCSERGGREKEEGGRGERGREGGRELLNSHCRSDLTKYYGLLNYRVNLTYLTSTSAELMGERSLSPPLVAAVAVGWLGPGPGNGGRLSDWGREEERGDKERERERGKGRESGRGRESSQ